MAAAIKAINAKIRSNKALDYFCSTRTFNPHRYPPRVPDRDRPTRMPAVRHVLKGLLSNFSESFLHMLSVTITKLFP